MKWISTSLAPLAATLLAACGTFTSFAPSKVGQRFPPRTPPERIELFRSQTPTHKFVELGAVTVCCVNDIDQSLRDLRAKASAEGGDALMGLDVNASGTAIATVIRYED